MCVADLLPVVFYQRYVCDREGKVSVEKQWAVAPIAYAYQACAQVHPVSRWSLSHVTVYGTVCCTVLSFVDTCTCVIVCGVGYQGEGSGGGGVFRSRRVVPCQE